MKIFFLAIGLWLCWPLRAQQVIDFEDFGLLPGEFDNDASPEDGFRTDAFLVLPNTFTQAPTFSFWSGWALSATADTTTRGFTNEYSAISGAGNGGSTTYAVGFGVTNKWDMSQIIDASITVDSFYVNNGTYSYFSMLEGDNFAKRFGGVTGDDPDFFLLTIRGWYQGEPSQDSVDFYLADYRFADNELDYIIDDWTAVDLTPLGYELDSITFELSSSDTSRFGFNTPAYFYVDDINVSFTTGVQEAAATNPFEVFPNPASETVRVQTELTGTLTATVFTTGGRAVRQRSLPPSTRKIEVGDLPRGTYFIHLSDGTRQQTRTIILR